MAESSSSNDMKGLSTECADDENQGITMLDVLKEEEELEDDVKAVLGAADDQNCTYAKGYVKRQALYACVSCIRSKDNRGAGVCLACSYHCHEGHELIELYTKRNFRCDCGNTLFTNKCNLDPKKDSENKWNNYNQNFHGTYCICKRPYPDPDDNTDDAMIQCIICEDWYHERHLGKPVPNQHDYGEMICAQCMRQHPFLASYSLCISDETTSGCFLEDNKKIDPELDTTYFPEGWRKKLCLCGNCQSLYEEHNVKFLLDEQDTVQAYEEKGKASSESQYERGMKALSSMGRVQQVEAIEEYNNMKSQLKEYLQKFAENKKIVREEDIREFFSGMEARKKQRVEIQLPYFCH